MAHEFKLPDLGEGIHEGEIVDVFVRPGDTITVHAGVYRERVNPPRGGTSEEIRSCLLTSVDR